MTDCVTDCCGYDFGIDGIGDVVRFCPICGAEIVRKKN